MPAATGPAGSGGGDGTGRPATAEARHTGRRRVQGAPADAVLGDGCAQPAPAMGFHVRPLGHGSSEGGQRPARYRRRGVRQLARSPRRDRRWWRGLRARQRRGPATFPHIEDQLRFVYYGTALYNIAGVADYGNPDRPAGAHLTGARGPMPAWGERANGELTDPELLAVVCHERYTLGGADETVEYAAEFAKWWGRGGLRDLRRSRSRRFRAADARGIGRGHHPDRHRAGARFSSRRRVTAPDSSAGDTRARPDRDEMPDAVDTIVIGAGPAGAAAAIRLATAGHRVTVLERRLLPRMKTCGDTLTPRAVHELTQLGVDADVLAGVPAYRPHPVDRTRQPRRGRLAVASGVPGVRTRRSSATGSTSSSPTAGSRRGPSSSTATRPSHRSSNGASSAVSSCANVTVRPPRCPPDTSSSPTAPTAGSACAGHLA